MARMGNSQMEQYIQQETQKQQMQVKIDCDSFSKTTISFTSF